MRFIQSVQVGFEPWAEVQSEDGVSHRWEAKKLPKNLVRRIIRNNQNRMWNQTDSEGINFWSIWSYIAFYGEIPVTWNLKEPTGTASPDLFGAVRRMHHVPSQLSLVPEKDDSNTNHHEL